MLVADKGRRNLVRKFMLEKVMMPKDTQTTGEFPDTIITTSSVVHLVSTEHLLNKSQAGVMCKIKASVYHDTQQIVEPGVVTAAVI